jgi:hypothetical protein
MLPLGGEGKVNPEAVAEKYGLKYRGEVSPGTGVHDFKAPDGGSFALKTSQLGDDKFITDKLAKRSQEIKPENLHPVARAKGEAKDFSSIKGHQQVSEESLSKTDQPGGEPELERLRRNPPQPVKELTEAEKQKADVKKKDSQDKLTGRKPLGEKP